VAVAAAGAVAGLVLWRRRSAAPPEPAVQLGTSDGGLHILGETDSSRAELEALAAGVRDALTGGT
jgi:hypothetical protein